MCQRPVTPCLREQIVLHQSESVLDRAHFVAWLKPLEVWFCDPSAADSEAVSIQLSHWT